MNLIFIDNNIPDLVLVELIKIDLRHLSKIRFLIIIRLHINEILIIKSTIDSFKKDVSILFQFLVKIILKTYRIYSKLRMIRIIFFSSN